jgi:hypothetical protein
MIEERRRRENAVCEGPWTAVPGGEDNEYLLWVHGVPPAGKRNPVAILSKENPCKG